LEGSYCSQHSIMVKSDMTERVNECACAETWLPGTQPRLCSRISWWCWKSQSFHKKVPPATAPRMLNVEYVMPTILHLLNPMRQPMLPTRTKSHRRYVTMIIAVGLFTTGAFTR
jgi:hypothetical protein